MEKIRLGKTGLMVSRIGLGGIPIQRVDSDEAVKIVRHCLDLGINYIDTSIAYTTSEGDIGKAIKGYKRDEIYIATKSHALSGEAIMKDLHQSLKNLDTDYIDLYEFHGVGGDEDIDKLLAPGGALEAVQNAQREGLVRFVGPTTHLMPSAIRLVKTDLFDHMQFPFNYITDEAKDELIPLCRQHDVGFVVMKPLSGGVLPNINLAFKFLLQFPDILPIPGIQSTQEIDEIIAISESSELTEEEMATIQKLREELGRQYCRRCDYCQPCPADIYISDIMYSNTIWNRMPLKKIFNSRFGTNLDKVADCIDCGICETRCPFELPIREIMAKNYDYYLDQKKKWEASQKGEPEEPEENPLPPTKTDSHDSASFY